MIWFTSDWHLGHANIRKHCPSRPWNHECVILENYCTVVRPGNIVYFLGDMVLRWGPEGRAWWNQIRCLPGRKILVPGNHDPGSDAKLQDLGGFEAIHRDFLGIRVGAVDLLLSHVPMVRTAFDDRYTGLRLRIRAEFDRHGQYLYNVHGHTHERNTEDPQCRNVSVENTNFCPAPWTTFLPSDPSPDAVRSFV